MYFMIEKCCICILLPQFEAFLVRVPASPDDIALALPSYPVSFDRFEAGVVT